MPRHKVIRISLKSHKILTQLSQCEGDGGVSSLDDVLLPILARHYKQMKELGHYSSPDAISGEKWKLVKGFPNYAVSDHGRVCRLRSDSELTSTCVPGKLRKPVWQGRYLAVQLWRRGKPKYFFLNRLVADHFRPKTTRGRLEVAHINHNKLDNRAQNLRWITRTENVRASRHGKLGGNNPYARLTDREATQMRVLHAQGWTILELVEEFGCTKQVVQGVISRKTYTGVGK